MHNWVTYAGLMSPLFSVLAVLWGALKAWQALEGKINTFAAHLSQCSASLASLTENIQALSERLARAEERVRGLEVRASESYHRSGYIR